MKQARMLTNIYPSIQADSEHFQFCGFQDDSMYLTFYPSNSILFWRIRRLMACLNSSSLRKLLPRWATHLFQRSSNHHHTSSSTRTSLWVGEACLAAPYSERVYAASARTSFSDGKSSIIDLPTPPQCIPAPAKIALPCGDTREIDYQRVQPMLFSFNSTPPVLEQT